MDFFSYYSGMFGSQSTKNNYEFTIPGQRLVKENLVRTGKWSWFDIQQFGMHGINQFQSFHRIVIYFGMKLH